MTKNNRKMSLMVLIISRTVKKIYFHCYKRILRKKYFDLIDEKSDKNEQILIIEAKKNKNNFIVINKYSSNTESEQLKTFLTLQNILNDIEISNKQIDFVRDFNVIFDCKRKTNDRNLVIRKKSLAKLI